MKNYSPTLLKSVNADGFRYFHYDDFKCSHTGKNEIQHSFIDRLDQLRYLCGFPLVVNSGFRDETHPAERRKTSPGWHTKGCAADLAISGGEQRRLLVEMAIFLDFGGIGVYNGFVHVDDRTSQPMLWVG